MADYPIFVYGTLLSRHFAHRLISLAVAGSAQGRLPGVRLHDLGSYPMAVEGAGEVHGEVHWLRPDLLAATLERLDEYEGREYRRLLLPIDLGDRQVEAWAYLGSQSVAARFPVIPTGRWDDALAHRPVHRSVW